MGRYILLGVFLLLGFAAFQGWQFWRLYTPAPTDWMPLYAQARESEDCARIRSFVDTGMMAGDPLAFEAFAELSDADGLCYDAQFANRGAFILITAEEQRTFHKNNPGVWQAYRQEAPEFFADLTKARSLAQAGFAWRYFHFKVLCMRTDRTMEAVDYALVEDHIYGEYSLEGPHQRKRAWCQDLGYPLVKALYEGTDVPKNWRLAYELSGDGGLMEDPKARFLKAKLLLVDKFEYKPEFEIPEFPITPEHLLSVGQASLEIAAEAGLPEAKALLAKAQQKGLYGYDKETSIE